MSGIVGTTGSKSGVLGIPKMTEGSPWAGELILKVSTNADNNSTGTWPGGAAETVKLNPLSLWNTDEVDFSSHPGVYSAMFQSCGRLSTYQSGYFQYYCTNSGGSTGWNNPDTTTDENQTLTARHKFNNALHSTIWMPPSLCGYENRTKKLRVYIASSQGNQVLLVWRHLDGLFKI